MAELKTMYPAQPNTPETTLAGALTTSDTSVTVLDGSILPDAPRACLKNQGRSAKSTKQR